MSKELLELTSKLISFKSISPNQAGCLDFVGQYLDNLGFNTTRLDRGSTSNLIARFGVSGPIFAYAGHIDVVPPGDLAKWQSNPFTLTKHNEKLYGRGIGDMKGSVAGFMFAVKQFLASNKTFPGSIMLLITSDEETVATDGTIVMVEYLKQNKIQIDYCLVGEPTSVEKLGDVIKIGRRGSLNGYLEILGLQGHIAYPELCKNPIHLFAKALNDLTTTIWDQGNEHFPATSLQFANINSGLGVNNVIPGSLLSSFNIRYNNLQTAESLQQKIIAILDSHGLAYNIKWQHSANPFYTKPGHLITAIKQAIENSLNITPQLKTDGGTSDGRFLIDVCNELLEFGLPNKSIHQINENINEVDLYQLSTIYTKILENIFITKNSMV